MGETPPGSIKTTDFFVYVAANPNRSLAFFGGRSNNLIIHNSSSRNV